MFNLDSGFGKALSFGELEEEYQRMDTTYLGWKLGVHKEEVGQLTKQDGPPFNIDLFRNYL